MPKCSEPVEKTGFKFGMVMGKRLIDYGIMSSSSDSADEYYVSDSAYLRTAGAPTKVTFGTPTKDKPQRNTMTRLPSEDLEQSQTQQNDISYSSAMRLKPAKRTQYPNENRITAFFGRSTNNTASASSGGSGR